MISVIVDTSTRVGTSTPPADPYQREEAKRRTSEDKLHALIWSKIAD